MLETAATLGELAAKPPETPKRPTSRSSSSIVARSGRVVESGAQVVALAVEELQPALLLGPRKLCRFGEVGEVRRVVAFQSSALPPAARRRTRGRSRASRTSARRRRRRAEGGCGRRALPAGRDRRPRRSPRRRASSRRRTPTGWRGSVARPASRSATLHASVSRSVCCRAGRSRGPAAEDGDARAETVEELARREHPGPRRRKLDRERQTVEAAADLRIASRSSRGADPGGVTGAGAGEEERHRVGLGSG